MHYDFKQTVTVPHTKLKTNPNEYGNIVDSRGTKTRHINSLAHKTKNIRFFPAQYH